MMQNPLPAPDVSRATRGRFLPRHGARVFEQDDLYVVEFVAGEAWYTAPRKRSPSIVATVTRFFAALLLLAVPPVIAWQAQKGH